MSHYVILCIATGITAYFTRTIALVEYAESKGVYIRITLASVISSTVLLTLFAPIVLPKVLWGLTSKDKKVIDDIIK